MTIYAALLRGINVGGHRKIRMAELRGLLDELEFEQVQTYLQSGNVVFVSRQARDEIRHTMETAILDSFGHTVAVLLRSADELEHIFHNNPFLTTRHENPSKLYVTFLADAPPDALAGSVAPPLQTVDEFVIAGREVFLFYPNGTDAQQAVQRLFRTQT